MLSLYVASSVGLGLLAGCVLGTLGMFLNLKAQRRQ
jgi:hypothetical protein